MSDDEDIFEIRKHEGVTPGTSCQMLTSAQMLLPFPMLNYTLQAVVQTID